jgi:8-oxo-dGTP pyrophosphatase MutT (NUDIX family)
LRETHEELGISPNQVEILGQIGPVEVNLRGDMAVTPFVGFVHLSEAPSEFRLDEPLPSIDLPLLCSKVAQPEVESVFHVPLRALTDPLRVRSSSLFRGREPYFTVDVTDLVQESNGIGIEIWGLTGWYLTLLMRILKLHPQL